MENDGLPNPLHVDVVTDGDLLAARARVRAMSAELGFSATEVVGIVTALSEMARNMLIYAGGGRLTVESSWDGYRRGIILVARDDGPGIPDVNKALLDGYSTSGGLGMGLPGIRRLMDEFQIISEPRKGTTVRAVKWLGKA